MSIHIPKYQAGKFKPGAIKLSSNESPLALSANIKSALQKAIEDVRRYPDSTQAQLKRDIERFLDVDKSQIILGNGSDEVIGFITKKYLPHNSVAIAAKETFSIYSIATQIAGARLQEIPLADGIHDLATFKLATKEISNTRSFKISNKHTRETSADDLLSPNVIFICNPNNPTGTCLSTQALRDYLATVPEHCYVVLDHAYIDFADEEYLAPVQTLLSYHPRLIILRTFSKIFGLAGLRLGVGISHAGIIEDLEQLRMPFNINSFALAAGSAALQDPSYYAQVLSYVRTERAQLMAHYHSEGYDFFRSQANFICLRVGNTNDSADRAFDFFAEHNIMIRSLQSFGLPTMVRISIGSKEENQKVKEVLHAYFAQYPLC